MVSNPTTLLLELAGVSGSFSNRGAGGKWRTRFQNETVQIYTIPICIPSTSGLEASSRCDQSMLSCETRKTGISYTHVYVHTYSTHTHTLGTIFLIRSKISPVFTCSKQHHFGPSCVMWQSYDNCVISNVIKGIRIHSNNNGIVQLMLLSMDSHVTPTHYHVTPEMSTAWHKLSLFSWANCVSQWLASQTLINPRCACAARVTVLSLSVCVCECVCYLANSYAVNAQVQSKIRIECKCAAKGFWFVDFAKNTLFKSYGVICSPQRTLTVSTARRYIRRTTGDYW